MKTLTLPVKAIYFEQIKNGEKKQEFRLRTPYWRSRLEGKEFDIVAICLGYPKHGDNEKWLFCKWEGYELKTIQHAHFGPAPVDVFAINIGTLV